MGVVGLALGGQTGAAFNPTAFQDLLTRAGVVAFHEAVFDLALALVGLISAFWHSIFPSFGNSLTNSRPSIP